MGGGGHQDVLAAEFEKHVSGGIDELRSLKYDPTQFVLMVKKWGAVGAAKRLLASGGDVSSGFSKLTMLGRLDASIEYAVCLPWFSELFTDEEIERAERRLELHEFAVDRFQRMPDPQWFLDLPSHRGPVEEVAAIPAARSYRQRVEVLEAQESAAGPARRPATGTEIVRSAAARALVTERSGGRCENPDCFSPGFEAVGRNGEPILEVDHVHGLAEGGRDHPVNMIAVCPNCHAVKTRGQDGQVAALGALFARVARERHADALAHG
ncbi:HNH endonuclease signature motif containing protein [Kitasatospora terrestris]|uniref:HNH nuclease domain-containing protein n=1 Tax=Kitasatospora terrestris TaxID=258051 RepID=A0ABP9EQK4_9ACTN